MRVNVEATLRVPSLGDLASIEPEIRDRLVDAEGRAAGEIEVTVTDNKMRCYFDSEIGM